jgi:hypothetical protein
VPLLLVTWGAFAAWCVAGFPPSVDLPAHGAQLQTLVGLLRGDSTLHEIYEVKFPIGYGLPFWLFLPIAWLWNGAVAARFALWATLMLYPVSLLALLKAFGRPRWYVLLGLPLAFNISYWYGLLPGLFAQPMVYLAIAAYAVALKDPRPRWLFLLNLAAAAAMLSHLVAFAALALAIAALALAQGRRREGAGASGFTGVLIAVLGLLLPVVISVPKVWSMATRAVTPGPWPATEYAAMSHVNWFFRNYRPEGYLAAWATLLITVAFVVLWWRRRRLEPAGPVVMFAALVLLYFATPKTLSGIYLISVRLPVLAGAAALLLVAGAGWPRWLRNTALALTFLSLVETAVFHHRFEQAIDGLAEITREAPPARHGYFSLAGREILGSRQIYLEHLGQWWTAEHGGVGHHFFADAEHHPVRFKPGRELPADLQGADALTLSQFDQILVFGEGPLPPSFEGWRELQRVKGWRKLERPQ